MDATMRNWAGNVEFAARAVHRPGDIDEVRRLVLQAEKVRVIGSRHSFNRIADTDGDLISLGEMNRMLGIDRDAGTVTVEGGITYGQLGPLLDAEGYALHNLASLPHISIVGATSTATHGSGDGNRNLAAAIAGLEIVAADGELVTLRRGDAGFEGAVVGLGALGVVVRVTLDVLPRFDVRQDIYLDLPVGTLLDSFDAVMGGAYSVSLFTGWEGDTVGKVWLKSLAEGPDPGRDVFGALPADTPQHPIPAIDVSSTTAQLGVPGAWHERLPHFGLDFLPSVGAELQSEYFVPRRHAVAAIDALRRIQKTIAAPLLISEIRTIAADTFWMSPCYGRDCVAFHFTWKPDWEVVRPVLEAIEASLRPYGAMPHWGKLFTMPAAEVQSHYPRLGDFRALCRRLDPGGKFRNAFIDEYVF